MKKVDEPMITPELQNIIDKQQQDSEIKEMMKYVQKLQRKIDRIVPWARAYASILDTLHDGDRFLPALEDDDLAPPTKDSQEIQKLREFYVEDFNSREPLCGHTIENIRQEQVGLCNLKKDHDGLHRWMMPLPDSASQ